MNNKNQNSALCDWQYQICHSSTACFQVGEVVIHKSNPTVRFVVRGVHKQHICVSKIWETRNVGQFFVPWELLQVALLPLVEYKRMFRICLN